ncbi:MAG: hypothetical protein LBU39_03740 [Desulfobulbaceae bacterium]|jgi:hypothetical protein|nr:hypothetical protein [Desulfobulbaceae bacterium]
METTIQYDRSSIASFYNIYFPEDCIGVMGGYDAISGKIRVDERHLDILICGAGSGSLEFPMLLSLINGCETANLIFIDNRREPFVLLDIILRNYAIKSKSMILQEFENAGESVSIHFDKVCRVVLSGCRIDYLFHVYDMDFDPNRSCVDFGNEDNLKQFSKKIRSDYSDFLPHIINMFNSGRPNRRIEQGKFHAVVMSMLLQHLSFWRSLIAYINFYLIDNGSFLISELGGDGFLFDINVSRAIVENGMDCESELQRIFRIILKYQFSIISDNYELCATNMQVCEHFFEFFGINALDVPNELHFHVKLRKEDIKILFGNPTLSSYKQYYYFFDAESKTIREAINAIPDESEFLADLTVCWKIFKKNIELKDKNSRIYHFNLIRGNAPVSAMSGKYLRRYINGTLNILERNKTVFSVVNDVDKEKRKNLIQEVLCGFLARFMIFKLSVAQVDDVFIIVRDVDGDIVFPLVNTIFCGDVDVGYGYMERFYKYMSLQKKMTTKPFNEIFFAAYKDVFATPFAVIIEDEASSGIDCGINDAEIVDGVHIVHLVYSNKEERNSLVRLSTNVQNSIEKIRSDLYASCRVVAGAMPGIVSALIPCFRDSIIAVGKSEREFTASLITNYQRKFSDDVKKYAIPFYSWLIAKIIKFSNFGDSIDFRRYNNHVKRESTKSAVAAIMSRNMSHNLGSHVVTNAKHQIEALERRQNDVAARQQLKGLSALLQYLQERQDFIAVVANDEHYPKGPLNLKSAVFDMLAMDGPPLRHGAAPVNNYILDNIVRSENIVRAAGGALRLELQLVKFDQAGRPLAFRSLGERKIGNEFAEFTLSVNNGLNGRQAFLVMLENIIRNAAKHDKEAFQRLEDNTLLFSLIIRPGQDQAGREFFTITICDNKRNFDYVRSFFEESGLMREGQLAPLRILRQDGGGLAKENKGLKEMLISLAWLKYSEGGAGGEGAIDYETVQHEPWRLLDVVGVENDDYTIYDWNEAVARPGLSMGYRFRLDKYKRVHLLTAEELQGAARDLTHSLANLPGAALYAARRSDCRDQAAAFLAAIPRLELVDDDESEQSLADKIDQLYERNLRPSRRRSSTTINSTKSINCTSVISDGALAAPPCRLCGFPRTSAATIRILIGPW